MCISKISNPGFLGSINSQCCFGTTEGEGRGWGRESEREVKGKRELKGGEGSQRSR